MMIPDRLKDRPTYQGFVIPITTLIIDGKPDFKVTDLEVWFRCVDQKLCAICGQRLDYWVWYIGSAKQIEDRTYFDPAMHEECARYAADVCPFIAYGKEYASNVKDHAGYKLVALASADVVHNPTEMYLMKTRRDTLAVLQMDQRHLLKVGSPVYTEVIQRKISK